MDNQAILDDPNIFIADTGATSDTTPYSIGMTDLIDSKPFDGIIDTGGNNIEDKSVGTLCGIVHDKTGREVQRGVIKNITHMLGSKFGLMSLTQRILDGWKLH